MRTISVLVLLAAIAVLTSACLGGSSHASSTPPPTLAPSVEWTIRYPIGAPEATKQKLPQSCPTDTRCTPVRQPEGAGDQALWTVVATRTVSCPLSGSGGDVPVDCRAITDVQRALRHVKHYCPCALLAGPAATASAVVHGRSVVVSLDRCCAGRVANAAAATLTRTSSPQRLSSPAWR
jgi:hypothetical protein